jgi:hypothetical protein
MQMSQQHQQKRFETSSRRFAKISSQSMERSVGQEVAVKKSTVKVDGQETCSGRLQLRGCRKPAYGQRRL